MYIVGIEGTSCAGKSTVASNILRKLEGRAIIVPEYVQFWYPGGRFPAANIVSTTDQIAAIKFFCAIERKRIELAQIQSVNDTIALLDRTVETLLAHTYALGNFDSAFLRDCAAMIEQETAGLPKPDFTIFLTAPTDTIVGRMPPNQRRPDLFSDTKFVTEFNRYFSDERCASWQCVRVDASAPIENVVSQCLQQMSLLLPPSIRLDVEEGLISDDLYDFNLKKQI